MTRGLERRLDEMNERLRRHMRGASGGGGEEGGGGGGGGGGAESAALHSKLDSIMRALEGLGHPGASFRPGHAVMTPRWPLDDPLMTH